MNPWAPVGQQLVIIEVLLQAFTPWARLPPTVLFLATLFFRAMHFRQLSKFKIGTICTDLYPSAHDICIIWGSHYDISRPSKSSAKGRDGSLCWTDLVVHMMAWPLPTMAGYRGEPWGPWSQTSLNRGDEEFPGFVMVVSRLAPSSVFFPNPGLQVMTAIIIFAGLTVISHCISRRLQRETLTIHGILTMPWPRMAVILMFVDSWLFLFGSGILIFGIGLEFNVATCTTAAYLCVVFYSTAKFFVYAFLAEKAHIVWAPRSGDRRLESAAYLSCLVSVSLYCIIMTLMLSAPIHEIRENGACVIGLMPRGSIPLLVYDLYINLFLTTMFVYPLFTMKSNNPGIQRLALRTCIASFVALCISTANVTLLIILKGRELAWVNLTFCSGDIIANAVAIFWVSGSKSAQQHSVPSNVPPAERHPRHNSEVPPYGANSKFPVPSLNPPPGFHETTTSGSFPRYLNGDMDGMRPGHFPKSKIAWVKRLWKGSHPRPETLNITVRTERYDSQHSQIELQKRSELGSSDEVLEGISYLPPSQPRH